ncbi:MULTISPECIES: isochorismatase family protein [unclassified Ensifer]|uniref:isochorismatase family protein n=1 Tax=unclassified Ensifer TaxID=2633371 RepID=UPI00192A3289|nr:MULTISPECIES: isochorismatase family protein [unclassified Ensifer]
MSENDVKLAQALLVVDVQRAFISGGDAVPDHLSLQRAVGRLLERAREREAPVLFLQNDGPEGTPDEPGTDGWQLFFDARPGETVVRKSVDDGFHGTDLEAQLRRHRVETLAICGMLSEMCLAATARRAIDIGFTA